MRFYINTPDLLNTCERNISITDLMNFSDINEAKEHFLEKEVESVLRENHEHHFKYFEKKLNIELTKGLKPWNKFIEICERRNLIVHANGKVSTSYKKTCNRLAIEIKEDEKILFVDRKYLLEACLIFLEIGIKLGLVVWNKLIPTDISEITKCLIEITYQQIHDGKYALATELIDFFLNIKAFKVNEPDQLLLTINKERWSGKIGQVYK